MQQAEKINALVAVGVNGVRIQEQLGMPKPGEYRCSNEI
jgi:hypothetical protein